MEFSLFAGAAAAGLLSFLSPCVFPLIPSYLAMLTGSSVTELKEKQGDILLKKRILLRSLSFSLGFTLLFVILGLVFSQATAMIGTQSRFWGRAAGIVIVVLGLHVMFDFISLFRRERRVHIQARPAGLAGSFLFGAAFGAGWSPCVGPILASILLLAGSGSPGRAALLLSVYSAGLALPFVLSAVFFSRLQGLMALIRRKLGTVRIVSGLLLTGIGLVMFFGDLRSLSSDLVRAGYMLQNFTMTHPVGSRILGIVLWIIPAAAAFARYLYSRSKPVLWLLIICSLVSALEAAGVIHSLGLLSQWLLFQGI